MTTLKTLQALSDEELIEKVAVEVMRWTWRTPVWASPNGAKTWCNAEGISCHAIIWNPLTDWNHTMEVVEAMRKRGFFFTLNDGAYMDASAHGFDWRVSFCRMEPRKEINVWEEQYPARAICVAVLLAVSA